MRIQADDLRGAQIQALLHEHLRSLRLLSPPGSVHALDLVALRRPQITFWTAWEGDELLGCGALKLLAPGHGDVKSMRTAAAHLRRGVARGLLAHIVDEARRRGLARLSLETGAGAAFEPAHALYASFGFERCEPFGDYRPDPHSVFMTKVLAREALAR
jgi:putative acetyltransferase